MEKDNIIKIENLKFRYNDGDEPEPQLLTDVRWAVDDVSLTVERGSFTVIIGRNGSGKSTLAKHINVLLTPVEGAVYVNGFDTKNQEFTWEIRKSAGMVFQNPDNQLVSAIVEDDVAFGPENLGVAPSEIRERVDQALTAVNMYEFRKKPPHLLSGGQKQRIAVAGVLAMKPECIIFDEPTAMLDPKGRQEVLEIMHRLHKEGITVILITHFMEEAMKADRVIILNKGKIALDGRPEEIFSRRERLQELNLDIPMPVALAEGLRREGMDIPQEVFTEEELFSHIISKARG